MVDTRSSSAWSTTPQHHHQQGQQGVKRKGRHDVMQCSEGLGESSRCDTQVGGASYLVGLRHHLLAVDLLGPTLTHG